MYYAMIQRLEVDEKNRDRPRMELDRMVDVRSWRIPRSTRHKWPTLADAEEIEKAPSWWRGDEDASQSFMHAMGIISTS